MKRIVLTVALLLCLVGAGYGAEEEVKGWTIWGGTADNADEMLMARIGYEFPDRIEPYLDMKWFTRDPEWGPQPDKVGFGLLYHVNEIVLVEDPEPDNPLEVFLHQLRSRPYAGIGIDIPTRGEQRNADLNYIAGLLFSNHENFRWSFYIEYIEGEGAITPDDERGVVFGGRFRW